MEHAQGMDLDGRMKDMVEEPVARASIQGRPGKQAGKRPVNITSRPMHHWHLPLPLTTTYFLPFVG
jgi:hypothetical protein